MNLNCEYEQLWLFNPTHVMTLEARPGEAWVQCLDCREYLLRTRLKASLSKKCPICGGQVSVYLDGGPKPRRKREGRTPVREAGL